MKNYNEVAECVFARSAAIIEKKKRSRKEFIRKMSTVATCIVATLLICVIYGGGLFGFIPLMFNDPPPITDGTVAGDTTSRPQESGSDTGGVGGTDSSKPPETGNIVPGTDQALINWKGKTVTASLAEVFQKVSPNDVIQIYMTCRANDSYVYSGKTVSEYGSKVTEALVLSEKLKTFAKVGDSLKYGEALYTTGTPTGEKWTKENYERTVAYYGNEIIQKYIVNEEFLKSKLSADIASLKARLESLQKEFEEAHEASISAAINNAQVQLSAQSISSTLSSGGDGLIININTRDFESMSVDNLALWTFSAQNGAVGDLNSPSDD